MKNRITDGLIIPSIIVLPLLKWFGIIQWSYWFVLSPILLLAGWLIISVIIGSIAYYLKK